MRNYWAIAIVFATGFANAMSVDWSGTYRFEHLSIDSTSLDSPKLSKGYILNHLSLSPKIIAADGFNIVGRFDVLTDENFPESLAGQPLGRGPSRAGTGGSSTMDDAAVTSGRQGFTNLKVSQLYLNINQEYGAIVLGRAPLEFGMGMAHNAGTGAFDHWADTLDQVGYRFLIGNLSIMPIIGKPYDSSLGAGGDTTDVIWNFFYDNPEIQAQFGVFHQTRTAGVSVNDAPVEGLGGTGASLTGGWNTQNVNIFFARGFEGFNFKLEAGFVSGSTGVSTSGGDEVKMNGYGIAGEFNLIRPESKWSWSLLAGVASGDDPSTANYEGYHFDRNYDVAFLLFNHPLGKYDMLRSQIQRTPTRCGTTPCAVYATNESIDDEVLSNAYYISPRFTYQLNDLWGWTGSLTWASLQVDPDPAAGPTKDLGFELDTGLVYRPNERVQWVNEVGLLMPGKAFSGGSNNYGNKFTYGFSSKAAISF